MAHPTLLVTGVPGWLGSRFLEVLLKGFEEGAASPLLHNQKVRCLIMKGTPASALRFLPREVGCIEADLRLPESLGKAVRGVETIFHLAGVIHPKRVSDFYTINTQGTRNLLDVAASANVRRFIYVSSNSAAGYTLNGQLMRETDPPRPYMAYGQSKYLAECAVREFAQRGRLEALILRPCWYYGPGQPQRQTRLFKMIKGGRPILFGDGQNLRSMSYLDNVIQGLWLAASAPCAQGQVYWIADEHPYPTLKIYHTVAELLQVDRLRPVHLPDFISEACMALDELLQTFGVYIQEIHVAGELNKDIACSIETASKDLGYNPQVGLREGMWRSIQWCRRSGIEL